jgi:hypothetical protein
MIKENSYKPLAVIRVILRVHNHSSKDPTNGSDI